MLSLTCNSFLLLILENYGVRKLEGVFAVLIATMALSFAWMFVDTKPSGQELLIGKTCVLIMKMLTISFDMLSVAVLVGIYELTLPCRYSGSKTQLKNNSAGSRRCWLCHYATQCIFALCFSAVEKY